MARLKKILPTDLSIAEIKKLLLTKERMETLEGKKEQLEQQKKKLDKALKIIEADLNRLMHGTISAAGVRKKRRTKKKSVRKARKKVAKKTTRKKTRKVTRKKAAKKATRKKGRKKAARKVGKVRAAPRTRGKATLEDVVVGLIKKNGKSMTFQDILATITQKKLVKTKSKNFANVLRRTLSTSKKVKRVGRGIYGLA